ncbi:hypothetical protein [Ancylobacter sp.]|uniref:hypothetical protein n=1 Tax=Ancylobacter sp. TaxID=1872567 RepID=UPI003BAB4271
MIPEDLWPVFLRRVREEIAKKTEDLALTEAKDYAHYRDLCGYLRGLREALEIGRDLLKTSNGDK